MIAMSYNELLDILEIVYKGDIRFEDFLGLGEKIESNKHLPRRLKMITDSTRANYIISIEEIKTVCESINKNTSGYESVKAAFIQSKPAETAISTLFETENKTPNYHHKIFYSRAAAIEWLLDG